MSEFSYSGPFDPLTATRSDILRRAGAMHGKPLRALLSAAGVLRDDPAVGKGAVGLLVERYFRIRQNNESKPDFPAAGIELKAIPIARSSGRVRVTQRTVISMVNYEKLLHETWAGASVRKKLELVLFVFCEYQPAADPLDATVSETLLWAPDTATGSQFERDWLAVYEKVAHGKAHEITESDGRLLGAATKGANSSKLVKQPVSDVKAKPRAWALKGSFTAWLRESAESQRKIDEVSLSWLLGVAETDDVETAAIEALQRGIGTSFGTLAEPFENINWRAKAVHATIVRRLLGLRDDRTRIREFAQRGIETKTVPLSTRGTPFEAMSFRGFHHMEVIDEEWENSELLAQVQRILIVPIVRRARDEPKREHRLGRSFFWSPTKQELAGIRDEWVMYLELIRSARANALPKASQTQFIHVRPKGRDSLDTEEAPGIAQTGKMAFWLNKAFVKRIIAQHVPAQELVARREGV